MNVSTQNDGYIVVEAEQNDLYDWARKPGAVWPCSTLDNFERIRTEIDPRNGDLVNLAAWLPGEKYAENDPEIDGHEFTAWCDDSLIAAGFAHLTRRLERSSGHIAFVHIWEFFTFGEIDDVYRAPIAAPITTAGIRGGARFEGGFSWWNRYGTSILDGLRKVT